MTDAASGAALLLSVALLFARRIDTAIGLCALQAWCAVLPLGYQAPAAAVLALALNGIGLPLAVLRMNHTPILGPPSHLALSRTIGAAILLATMIVFAKVGSRGGVAVGAAVALLGLLIVGLRLPPGTAILGLLSSQNGLILVAGADPQLSLSATVAVALPVIPGLVLADAWLRR